MGAGIDLEAVVALARSAAPLPAGPVSLPAPGRKITVGVAGGKAFTFTYTDTLDALRAAGAEVVVFDPLTDSCIPPGIDGLLIGGGFPEVHAGELAANRQLLVELAAVVRAGVPTWAECGGLLLLSERLDHSPLAGVVPARATMTSRLTLGYREAVTASATPLGPVGTSCGATSSTTPCSSRRARP